MHEGIGLDYVGDFPKQLQVQPDKENRTLFIDRHQGLFSDDATIVAAFESIDQDWNQDRDAKMASMYDSIGSVAVKGSYGDTNFDIAVRTDEDDSRSDEMLILTSPLNDGRPTSKPAQLLEYLRAGKPSARQISAARPNSWSPITKLTIGHELIKKSGRPMPVAQILAPVAPRAMTFSDRLKLLRGDYTGYGKLAAATIDQVNAQREAEGKAKITNVHFFGAGIGQRAIGAARYIHENRDDLQVRSAHAMNLALKRGVIRGLINHLRQSEVGDEVPRIAPMNYKEIAEPQMRREIDAQSDSIRVMGRQLNAARHLLATIIPLFVRSESTVEDMQTLVDGGVAVRVSNSRNTGMAVKTPQILSILNERIEHTDIIATAGRKVGMMANEYAGLVAVLMSTGIRDADQR